METERLLMRPFEPGDDEAIFAYSSDPENTRYMLWDTARTIEDTRAFLNAEIKKYATGKNYDYSLILKPENKLIGAGGADMGEGWFSHMAEIGYILNKKYWGKGYAAEAMRALADYLFTHKDIRRIQAKHFVGNDASGRVMEKIGMKYEGTLKDYVFVRSALYSVKMYGMLK